MCGRCGPKKGKKTKKRKKENLPRIPTMVLWVKNLTAAALSMQRCRFYSWPSAVIGCSYGLDSIPGPGISTCHRYSQKILKKEEREEGRKHEEMKLEHGHLKISGSLVGDKKGHLGQKKGS